ncbi:MAG: DUF2127 domain-containing protein [Burkholderiales bacterium]|nr:DUF2127 domain-containing protein [Burkholderiales bacterium]
MRLSSAVRAAAVLEAAKGALVILVGMGLLSIIHHDVQGFAERLVAHTHLNPAARFPRIFLEAAGGLTNSRLALLAAGAAAYAAVRFVEAYGLWMQRRWAEWFAALSGGVYIPFEVREILENGTWLSVVALLLSSAIVALMLYSVSRSAGARRGMRPDAAAETGERKNRARGSR